MEKISWIIAFFAILTNTSSIGQISITTSGTAYTQNFNTFTGANPYATGWSYTGTYRGTLANTNCSNTQGGIYGWGTAGNVAFGLLRSGTNTTVALAGNFVNNTGATITSIEVSWDYKTFGACNTSGLNLTGTGGLSANATVNGTDYTGGATTPVNLTLTVSIANGATFGFAWANTDVSGADNGLGIDNFSLTAFNASPTITTGAITTAPFFVPSCSSTGGVAFTSTGTFTAGNVYTAQLSDAAGAFGSPVNIGTTTSTANSGSISLTIPSSTATGTGYRIRVVSSTPSVTGSLSAAFTINNGSSGTAGLWTGTTSTDWFNCRNWSNYTIPTATTDVTINQTASNNCVIGANGAVCKTLTLASSDNNNRSLTINATRTLNVGESVTINKTGGTGTLSLINNGTLSTNSSGDFTVTKSGATTGTISVTNSSTGTIGIGAGNLVITQTTATGTGDNILFTNAGTLNASGPGNITLTKSAGSGNVALENQNTISCGNLTIDGLNAGSGEVKLKHELTTGSVTVTNLTIQPGGELDLSDGNSGTPGGTVFVRGNFTNNALETDFKQDESTIVFNGAGTQNISIAGTNTEIFYNLTCNKSSGLLVLSDNIRIDNLFTMSMGNLDAQTNTLELGMNTADKGNLAYTSGYVLGAMTRWFSGTNSGNASSLFPMGYDNNGIKNRHVSVEYTSAPTGGSLTVQFKPVNMGMDGIPVLAASTGGAGFDVTSTEDQGYWQIDNTNLTNGVYKITCTGEGFGTITDLSTLTLLKRVGAGNWLCPGTHIAATGTSSIPVLSRSGLTGWSNFGFGGGVANPLPVELISFTAHCGDFTTLSWSTASETNSDYFTVEKSVDGIDWMEIAKVKSAGNTTQLSAYTAEDPLRQQGIVYYRLKQFDQNGKSRTYDAVSMNCAYEVMGMNVYPNPSSGNFTTEIYNPDLRSEMKLTLTSSEGKTVFSRQTLLEPGKNMLPIETNILPGIYFLTADWKTGRETLRLIIK